jgi:hypothetical protein
MDKINHRFGRNSILIGMTPSQGQSFSGSKIAFTRIPDVDEFFGMSGARCVREHRSLPASPSKARV